MTWQRQSEALKKALKDNNLTQTMLCRMLFATNKPSPGQTQIVNNWTRNKQAISVNHVRKVCSILKLDLDEFTELMAQDYKERIKNAQELSVTYVSSRPPSNKTGEASCIS
jgi:hypothetical protein